MTERRRRQRPKPKQHQYTQHDHALIRAKREKRKIALVLAVETPFTSEDGSCVVTVSHVDRHAVEFITGTGRKHWINKAFIVSTGDADD